MNAIKKFLRAIFPARLYTRLLDTYHLCLAYAGAFFYRFPSRRFIVIAVTGTKGKSSTTELINAIFEEANYETALLNSIRIKIGDESAHNTMRMSMPGRLFIQRFLSRAAGKECDVAILEMTSEGARQHRHRAIDLNCLVFTNLAPEHIESHGSFDKYSDAKFEIGKALSASHKRPRIMVANADDPASERYLKLPVERSIPFSLSTQQPWSASETEGHFTFEGLDMHVHLPGKFSLTNALAAAHVARAFGIEPGTIQSALEKIRDIPGRAERIESGQDFTVVVDYAHTPDSLKALYDAYSSSRKICVLGATGGGRDTWKRPVMGEIADTECDTVILTNEDPYDEDPRRIMEQLAQGMRREPEVIMDRRAAISRALEIALSFSKGPPLDEARGNQNSVAVLITGKGTDPCICGPRGTKEPWSDAQVAREEIAKVLSERTV